MDIEVSGFDSEHQYCQDHRLTVPPTARITASEPEKLAMAPTRYASDIVNPARQTRLVGHRFATWQRIMMERETHVAPFAASRHPKGLTFGKHDSAIRNPIDTAIATQSTAAFCRTPCLTAGTNVKTATQEKVTRSCGGWGDKVHGTRGGAGRGGAKH